MSASAPQSPIRHRYDFVLLFEVANGNPNGDPDAGNAPRIDPETGHGLVSDVALKRKLRNYVALAKAGEKGPAPGYDIYVKHHGVLEHLHRHAYEAQGLLEADGQGGKAQANVEKARAWMCQTYFDVRAFGAVMSLKSFNCGQVRGPVQITFSRSVEPIATLEQSITRIAVATDDEAQKQIKDHGQVTGTMGRKDIVPYALYRVHGFVSPHLAADTGFHDEDLALLWQALTMMFEPDRSATRGEMATRRLVVFEHESALGNAPAHVLFQRVRVTPTERDLPARRYEDYDVVVDAQGLPTGVTLHEML